MAFSEKHYFGSTQNGAHKIVYNDWGPQDGNPIICVHGLTGNGHDFDYLAEALIQNNNRLICVDMIGRGRSDFMNNPLDYNYTQYVQDLIGLLIHLDLKKPQNVDWLGVSMGGLLGIHLAGVENSPIKRLMINDVGPEVPQAALDFIYKVISQDYVFDTVQDMEQRMRKTRGITWGPVTDEQWRHMAEHNARALDDGRITYSYDPNISVVFEDSPIGEVDLWPFWDNVKCPTLLIQGKQSVILTDDIIDKMDGRGPSDCELVIFKGCGHVPSLMALDQIKVIEQWLNET